MNNTVVSLAIVSVGFAGWMWYLGRRASEGALARTGPGIRVPATKVCEHTWSAAQVAAAPRYTRLAVMLVAIAGVTLVLDLVGVESTTVVIAWFIAAIAAQALMLAGAGRDATAAATAVRCEHQSAPKPARGSSRSSGSGASSGPRATSRTNARRGSGKRSRRR